MGPFLSPDSIIISITDLMVCFRNFSTVLFAIKLLIFVTSYFLVLSFRISGFQIHFLVDEKNLNLLCSNQVPHRYLKLNRLYYIRSM